MKIIILTGATGGIGEAAADALARDGYCLLLVANHTDTLQKLELKLKANFPNQKFWSVRADLSVTENIDRIFTIKDLPYENLYGLVNNAGISIGGDVFTLTEGDWDKDLAVNLKAPFFVSQQFISVVKKQATKGVIINISSIAGINGTKKPNYSASKSGIIGVTKSIASAVGPIGIRVNAIVPGAVDTPMIADWDVEKRHTIEQKIPLRSIAKPGEIAEIIAFLLSDKASYITGAVINATGGQYLG